jgi:hypothetical protein
MLKLVFFPHINPAAYNKPIETVASTTTNKRDLLYS